MHKTTVIIIFLDIISEMEHENGELGWCSGYHVFMLSRPGVGL